MSESVWPDQKSRKLRWRSARNGFSVGGIAKAIYRVPRDIPRAGAYALEGGFAHAIPHVHEVQPGDGRRGRSPVAARQARRLSPAVRVRRRQESAAVLWLGLWRGR